MKNKIDFFLIIILFLAASFFRLYKIDQLAIFDYDQARDALFTKRLVADGKFRLIGPQSSPGFYTGPAYYYLMAPFLFWAKLDPSGMDVGVAVLNIVAVLLLYFLLRKITGNEIISFFFSFLYSIQPKIVWQSRFSWNPNVTPVFMVLFIFGLILVLEKKSKGWLLSAISLGFLNQLHFATFSLIPMFLLMAFLWRKRKVIDKWFFFSLVAFLGVVSPFLAVELRHNFPNSRYFLKYLSEGPAVNLPPAPLAEDIWIKLKFLFVRLPFGIDNNLLSVLLIIAFLVSFFYVVKNNKQKEKIVLIISPIVFLLLTSFFYRNTFFEYYLTFLYPVPFLLLGLIFSTLYKNKKFWLFLILFSPLILINIGKDFSYFLDSSLKASLYKIASVVANDDGVEGDFNIVSIKEGSGYYNGVDYRYFLETYFHQSALDWDISGYQNSETVYVVSSVTEFDPLNSNIWELSLFGPQNVEQRWTDYNGITIFKLTK